MNNPTDSFEKVFSSKNKMLIVFSHPDDAELYSGGTIARLIAEGKEVRVVKMTMGEKGSRQEKVSEEELKKIRLKEDKEAMKTLGLKDENNIYLDLGDGQITNDMKIIETLVKQVREFNPNLVITHNPENIIIRFAKDTNWFNHRDHLYTGRNIIDATYPYARDLLFFPEHLSDPKYRSHTVTEFLFVDSYGHEDEVFIDVTDYLDTRIKAHACHSSQYSMQAASDSADFFTKLEGTDRRYERFRYVVTD